MEFSGQYLTYDEFRQLGGTLDIMPFNLLEFHAQKVLDIRSQRRLINVSKIPQEVKLCLNDMIKCISSYNETLTNGSKNISSESTDGYSVTYASSSEIQEIIKTKNGELEDIMFSYLADTGLIYVGV